MFTQLSAVSKVLTIVFAVEGVVAIVVGVLYVALPAHSLPHFIPAYSARTHLHATKHGIAALALGVVLIVVAVIIAVWGRRQNNDYL
jgi:hypothetical protein